MKNLILLAISVFGLSLGTGCVMTPTGEIISSPDVSVGVEAGVGIGPRIYTGSRSAVSIWLHPSYVVADAYPVAQSHCNRWGMWARPAYDWSFSASVERHLNYTCVSYRPTLAYPHYRRNHNHHRRNHNRRRRWGHSDRADTVYTPKPVVPYHPRRRGTFGRIYNPPAKRSTVVERGKPWEHNRNKRPIVTPGRRGTVIERGKPWEHNTNKNRVIETPKPFWPKKRSTFGRKQTNTGTSFGTVKTKKVTKSRGLGFGSVNTKKVVKSKVRTRGGSLGFGSIKSKKVFSSGSKSSIFKPKPSFGGRKKGKLRL